MIIMLNKKLSRQEKIKHRKYEANNLPARRKSPDGWKDTDRTL